MHIPRVPPKVLKITGIIIGVLFFLMLVGVTVIFVKRESILQSTVARIIRKAKADYNLDVQIKNPRFDGLSVVLFDEISAVPAQRDSLALIRNLRVGVKLMPLLFGEVKLAELKLASGKINLVKKDSVSNYDFLFRRKKKNTSESSRSSLADLADNLLNTVLNKVPDDLDIKNFDFVFRDDKDTLRFFTPGAVIDDGYLKSTIILNKGEATWHLDGPAEPDQKLFDLRLFADGKKVSLPVIEKKYKLKVSFDTINVRLNEAERDGDELHVSGTWAVRNLVVNHPKLSSTDILVPTGAIDANFTVGENFVALDSSSVIRLKNIRANPYLKYTLTRKKIYELKLHTGYQDAQEIFNAFPPGLFETLEGIKVSGQLQYDLSLYLDGALPDSVQFNSSLNKRDFKIIKWGKTNFQKINSPFVYTPYEDGKPMRDIEIGPKNPNFIPLEGIAPDLRNAVLTAEDPSFFSHHGFVELAFRRSIATNFKKKAFKQGGSTISMQLVKNVFLSRQKTLLRKIDEALIVWLIENNRVTTKSKMLEAYLNLIEWGRNVYGIGEAANYYFGKHASQLSLGESIFLASIVPKPKKGLYFFEPDGSLRPGLAGYFRMIGGLMARRGLTAPDTSGYGFYNVRLKESLRTLIAPADSTASDSTLFNNADERDEDPESFLKRVLNPEKKMDTISIHDLDKLKVAPKDTVKTGAQKRKERRDARKQEKEEKKRLKELEKKNNP
ncbi:biosynthetic peptidoglycan transglycosylase [Hufsiella ginkgonis]|uniref:Penicillin-binding protein n=1 Tax=Hufsiella ginkgonis TaxID=2695274 RepID=A0A7K1XUT3_9SPHI|nr:biosynthetic peptidoglycan transglycosylase [Hufsiella ginkgonis]MXV14730.1 penicillin-binding protein [Hufsiella ginkgonis]